MFTAQRICRLNSNGCAGQRTISSPEPTLRWGCPSPTRFWDEVTMSRFRFRTSALSGSNEHRLIAADQALTPTGTATRPTIDALAADGHRDKGAGCLLSRNGLWTPACSPKRNGPSERTCRGRFGAPARCQPGPLKLIENVPRSSGARAGALSSMMPLCREQHIANVASKVPFLTTFSSPTRADAQLACGWCRPS
ncbi:hypothetical protein ACVIHH_007813 [Bradyrhizobium sp. USDA 4518]